MEAAREDIARAREAGLTPKSHTKRNQKEILIS
jgi:hypothetical protein